MTETIHIGVKSVNSYNSSDYSNEASVGGL